MSTPNPPTVNGNPLSEREMEVARLLATGLSNAEIARQLIISPHTVKVHLRNIFEKLAVSSRTEASMLLVQRGWLIMPGAEPAPLLENVLAPLLPEPEPLADLPAQILPWQRLVLLVALVVCLGLLIGPNIRAWGATAPDLLSDAGRTVLGKPLPQIYPRWAMRTPMNVARSRLALAQIDAEFYAIGGQSLNGELLADVDRYDLQTNEWSSRQPLPTPLINATAAALAGRIYVAGGNHLDPAIGASATITEAFLVYEPTVDQWHTLGALPHPLAGAQLVADETALYLIGGWDGQAMRDEVWRFTPAKAPASERPVWELVTRLATPRAFLGAVIAEGQLYVVGGFDGQDELADTTVYTLASGEWQTLAPLTTPRGGLSLVYDGLAIFAIGGGWTHTLTTLERYDPAANVWSNTPSPLQGEWRHLAATSYNDRLHLLGGWSGDYLDLHLEYQSTFRTMLPVISND